MKIIFVFTSLFCSLALAQNSFSITQKNQDVLKSLDKSKRQVFTFIIKNDDKHLNDVDARFVRMKDQYCKLLPVKSAMLKSGQSTQISISCDLSKVPSDVVTFDRKFKIQVNSMDVIEAEVQSSIYSPKTQTLVNDTCNHPWRARCKNQPKELLSLCVVASGHYMDTAPSLDYNDCKKGARQIRAKNVAEVQKALADIYNNECGVVQNLQFLNPKTLFGYENEDWETSNLMKDKNLACLYTANANLQFKGSDLGNDCVSDIYKMKLARQFNSLSTHSGLATTLVKNCQKSCLDKNKNASVGLCNQNSISKNISYIKDTSSCENFTTADQFIENEKSL